MVQRRWVVVVWHVVVVPVRRCLWTAVHRRHRVTMRNQVIPGGIPWCWWVFRGLLDCDGMVWRHSTVLVRLVVFVSMQHCPWTVVHHHHRLAMTDPKLKHWAVPLASRRGC